MRGTAPDSQCISIDIVDDMDFEESQNYSVSIMTISPPIAAAGEFATVVIQDNNGIVIISMRFQTLVAIYLSISFLSFIDSVVVMVNSSQSVNEDDGSVKICVDSGITGSLQTELAVTLSSFSGKASKQYIISRKI